MTVALERSATNKAKDQRGDSEISLSLSQLPLLILFLNMHSVEMHMITGELLDQENQGCVAAIQKVST